MTRRILIVGAGQAGLLLALGLQAEGYDVTLMSNRGPDVVRSGSVMSTQTMFHTALQAERDLGLNFWEGRAPKTESLGMSLALPRGPAPGPGASGAPDASGASSEKVLRDVNWLGRLRGYSQSVDQRLKMAGWMEAFALRGGHLVLHPVSVPDLDRLAGQHELTLIASGRGGLVGLFPRDAERSVFSTPQRALAVAYVHGVRPRPEFPEQPSIFCNVVPGVGELFVMPSLTHSGPCDILFFEAVPGGPLDVFEGIVGPDRLLATMLDRMRDYLPWEYERCRHAELTDGRAVLAGRYTPTVRQPIAELPSGMPVLGVADVIVTNDPVTGQGANNAARCGVHYLHAILQHGDRPYDRAFMRETFDRYWDHAQHVTRWTNSMLPPHAPHLRRLLAAAEELEPIADRIANGFDDPEDFADFWYEADSAERYMDGVRASLGISSVR